MKCIDTGPPSAKIVFIGEAPGAEEERAGRPFVGPAGKMLRQMVNHVGIDIDTCYITNVMSVRPPNNDFGFFYEQSSRRVPTQALTTAWYELREKIKQIKPNIVVCLGAEPLKALTGLYGISNHRGIVQLFNNIKVIATYHPSAVMREYSLHPIVEMDLAKALKESRYPEHKWKAPFIVIQPSLNQTLQFINEASKAKRVSFDIETLAGTTLRCIGIAYKFGDNIYSCCIPFIRMASSNLTSISLDLNSVSMIPSSGLSCSYWSAENEVLIIKALAELFSNPNIEFVGQNSIAFDQPIIEETFGFSIANHYLDIMHAWHCIYSELPKGLDFMISVLTDYPNYWSNHNADSDDSEWKYNAYDCSSTLELSYKVEAELVASKQDKPYREIVHPLAFALARMSDYGIMFDKDAKKKALSESQAESAKIELELEKSLNKKINLNSPKQLKELLYDYLKYPVIKNKNGKPSVDEESLKKLERNYSNEPLFNLIIRWRKESKLQSSFLSAEVDDDLRMHTSYNASGTKGSRISSSQDIRGKGMNLQNVPAGRSKGVRNLKNVFIAGNGKKLVKADLSQAETRVVAELLKRCGDSTLSDKYKEPNFDIHKWAAHFIYNVSESLVTKEQRAVGKLYNHSGNYGAGPRVLLAKALKEGINEIDYNISENILDTMQSGPMKGLKIWWLNVEQKLRSSRTLTTCLGRRRIFFGRLSEYEGQATFRDAYAYEPQSIVGDVCNIIVTRLDQVSSKFIDYADCLDDDCRLVLSVHDEVVVECPENKVDKVKEQIRRASFIPLFINETPLIIPIDITTGDNWRDCC